MICVLVLLLLSELPQPLVSAASEPRSAAELLPVLFRRQLDEQQLFFAMGEAIAHLNHLWLAGRMRRQIDDRGTIRFARA